VGLVAACDIAVAVEGAKFALTEVKLGLVPAMISPFVLDAIGSRQATRYFHTAERFSAIDAQRIGLVHEVVADESALSESRARIVGDLLAAGPEASVAAKKLVADVAGRLIDEAMLQDLATRIAARRAADEGIEGLSAFLERRPPQWAR
jgi:methylglutaconyl-CoA hydratase